MRHFTWREYGLTNVLHLLDPRNWAGRVRSWRVWGRAGPSSRADFVFEIRAAARRHALAIRGAEAVSDEDEDAARDRVMVTLAPWHVDDAWERGIRRFDWMVRVGRIPSNPDSPDDRAG